MEPTQFEAWGIVDLFGHQRIAGRIGEQTIGGETFIRVDIPNAGDGFHTRLFGKGAIYGISLTDETIAREAAKRSDIRPVSAYDVAALVRDVTPQIEERAKLRLAADHAFKPEPDPDCDSGDYDPT